MDRAEMEVATPPSQLSLSRDKTSQKPLTLIGVATPQ